MSPPRGNTNPVTVLLMLGLAVAGWWGWVYGEAYYDNFTVKEEVWMAFSTTLTGDVNAREKLIRSLNTGIGWHYQIDEETGEETVAPGLGVSPDAVDVTLDPEVNLVRVRVEYDRVLPLKPTNRRTRVHFVAERTGKIK